MNPMRTDEEVEAMDDWGGIVDDELLATLRRAAPEPPAGLMEPGLAEATLLLDRLIAQSEPQLAAKARGHSTAALLDRDTTVSEGIAGEITVESVPALAYAATRPPRRRLAAAWAGAAFVAVVITVVALLVFAPRGGSQEQILVGGGPSGTDGSPTSTGVIASSTGSASPKAAAQAFARSVMSSVSVPAGATVFGGPIPTPLVSPEVVISAPTLTVDDDRLWAVSLTPDELLSYAKAHPPAAGGFFESGGGPPGTQYIVAGVQSPASTQSAMVVYAAQATATGSLLRVDVVVTFPPERTAGEDVTTTDRTVSVTWVPGISTTLNPSPASRVVTDPSSVVALANLFNELPAISSSQLICDLTARIYTVSFAPSPSAPADFVAQQTCDGWSIVVRGKSATDLQDSSALEAALTSIAGQ
jgi:hypothetical protein